ncbi:uncharacterized protein LOC121367147 [Gigantopelta aegis]|uniref:uncharacterized protein LOC121367147 n=1 Tax=Gigantopelta aegis TaxID=1735272 RepID=UPI001B88AC4A|nr:uncharacterized protein LOC121367147 [Gigantopelta aegis]
MPETDEREDDEVHYEEPNELVQSDNNSDDEVDEDDTYLQQNVIASYDVYLEEATASTSTSTSSQNSCARELALSGSSSYAVFNQQFTLTCTVTQAAGLGDTVQFFYNASTDVFASLYQNGDSCDEFSGPSLPSDYSVSCGSGTDSSSSTTKKYTLKINRVADRDAIGWWCILSSETIRSNVYYLQLRKDVPGPKPCDWCIGLSVVISILIVAGIGLIAIFLVSDASRKKILIKPLLAVGGILLIMAIVVAGLLGTQTDVDQGTGVWIAAVVFCGIGFLVGIILVGVWLRHKTGKADSGSVNDKPTNTPGQPTELHSTNAHRQPLDANSETINKPPK